MTGEARTEPVGVPGTQTAPRKPRADVPLRTPPKRLSRAKLKKRVTRAEQDLERALTEGRRLKWFAVLMFTTWPIGLIWGPWWAAYIAVGWFCFWAVGHYLNFFHRRNARIRLEEAREDLALAPDDPPTDT